MSKIARIMSKYNFEDLFGFSWCVLMILGVSLCVRAETREWERQREKDRQCEFAWGVPVEGLCLTLEVYCRKPKVYYDALKRRFLFDERCISPPDVID